MGIKCQVHRCFLDPCGDGYWLCGECNKELIEVSLWRRHFGKLKMITANDGGILRDTTAGEIIKDELNRIK